MKDELEVCNYFGSIVYNINKPEFLKTSKKVFKKYLKQIKSEYECSPIYPIYQTSWLNDESMDEFISYINDTAWNVLYEQGYDMDLYRTYTMDLWGQSLNKHAMHVEHTHAFGSQISGFYFLDVPESSSSAQFHDPNPARRQIGLWERDMSEATLASNKVHYNPKPGDLFFFNSWLGHGFSPNASDKPLNFIHFNIGVNEFKQSDSVCFHTDATVI